MTEIRNPDNRLVCRIDEGTGKIEILEKGWVTTIHHNPGDSVKVTYQPKVVINNR